MTPFSRRPHRSTTALARTFALGAAIVLLATACTAAVSQLPAAPAPAKKVPPTTVPPTTVPPTTVPTTVPAPIPPASSVLYDSNATGNFEIYRRNLATGAVTQLTNDRRYDSWWTKASPDGTRIVFYRTPAGVWANDYKQTSLWMANIDGSGLRQVIANGQNGWAVQGHVEWSPDGTKLVMFGGTIYNGIVITDTNGVQLNRVGNGIDPVWSSDGKQIIYINCARAADFPSCPVDQNRVWAVNVDGSSPHMLVDIPVGAYDPTMSPDGSTIAFETNPGGLVWDLWLANADGSNPRKLLSDGNINSSPVWASNTQLFFFKTMPFRNGFQLYTINKDGSALTWVSQGQAGIAEWPCPIP
jgi:Tol biopolymer transport system component